MTFSVRTWGFMVRFVQRREGNRESIGNKTEILDFAKSRHYAVKPFILLGFLVPFKKYYIKVFSIKWRTVRDSNPRYVYTYAHLAGECFRPLSQLSILMC